MFFFILIKYCLNICVVFYKCVFFFFWILEKMGFIEVFYLLFFFGKCFSNGCKDVYFIVIVKIYDNMISI